MEKPNLSACAYDRIIKVARTIADLNSSKDIKTEHYPADSSIPIIIGIQTLEGLFSLSLRHLAIFPDIIQPAFVLIRIINVSVHIEISLCITAITGFG